MTNSTAKQEVEITDIRMRFGSMVVFMVKWALASIPALIIVVMLWALLWAGALGVITALTSHPSMGSLPGKSDTKSSSGTSDGSSKPSADEAAYFAKVLVKDARVGQGVLGERGVFGEVKNTGDRTLKAVEITVYCLGPDGKPVFEKTYHPVLVSELGFGESNQPLKPGYSRTFGVKLDDAPSDWDKKNIDVKVSQVEFQ